MKKTSHILFLFLLIAGLPLIADAQVAPDKINRELLAESLEGVLGVQQPVEWISKPIPQKVKKSLKNKLKIKQSLPDTLYLGKVKIDSGIRYLIADIAPSKAEQYSYVLYLDQQKKVVDVDVLEYRENYGYEIDYDYFREQFHGKADPREVRFRRTIQNISGATISARSLTYSVHDLLALIQKITFN